MRALLLCPAVVFLACGPELGLPAREAGLRELSHTATVRFTEGLVHVEVHRTLRNDGAEGAAATRSILLPEHGVVTRFQLGRPGGWTPDAPLSLREQVDLQWEQLTAPGDGEGAALGRLDWEGEGAARLELFAVGPGETVEVSYAIEAPATYSQGALWARWPLDVEEDGWLAPDVDPGSIAHLDTEDDAEAIMLRQAWVTRAEVDARFAQWPVDSTSSLWRLELEVTTELEPRPTRPAVVFAIDASHSQGTAGIAAQLALIEPYLAQVPDARVELVVYRRFAERVFNRLVTVDEALRVLPTLAVSPGNGSHLDAALILASEALATEAGPRRVVAFTDEEVRHGLSIDATAAQLVPGAIVHLVTAAPAVGSSSGALHEERDVGASLAPLAEVTGGALFHVSGQRTTLAHDMRALEALVHPTRIDDLSCDSEQLELPSSLSVGDGLQRSGLGAEHPSLTLRGRIWGRPWTRRLVPDRSLEARLPRLVVGDASLREALDDDALRSVAMVGGVVSPVTSFFAAPSDAQPSVWGVEASGLNLYGCFGTSSHCGFGTRIHGASAGPVRHDTLRDELEQLLRARCPAAKGSLTVEVGSGEVLDVAADAEARACLEAAAWALEVPPAFPWHRQFEWTF